MTRLFRYAAFLAAVFMTTSAFAASAVVTTALHLRTGPSGSYRVVATMPDGALVNVGGCVRGYGWCRVDWNGYQGWASANYLAFRSGRYAHRSFDRYGAQIGIPLVAGVVIGEALGHRNHHDRHDRYRHHRRHDGHRYDPRHHGATNRHDRHDRQAHQRRAHHAKQVHRRQAHHAKQVHRRQAHHAKQVHRRQAHHAKQVHRRQAHHAKQVHRRQAHHARKIEQQKRRYGHN